MTARTFLTISSIFAILYGLGFLLAPGQSIATYGSSRKRTSFWLFASWGQCFSPSGSYSGSARISGTGKRSRRTNRRHRSKRVEFASKSVGYGARPLQWHGVVEHNHQSYLFGRRALLVFERPPTSGVSSRRQHR